MTTPPQDNNPANLGGENPYRQQPAQPQQSAQPGQQQGPNAFDQASQQAAQLGAQAKQQAKQQFNKASSALQTSTIKQLGFLPLLIGSIAFAVLLLFKWFKFEIRGDEGRVALGFNGFGYLSLPKEFLDEMSADEKSYLWMFSIPGLLVPLAVVVLLILAAVAFNNTQTQRRGGLLALIGSSLGLFWVFNGARAYGSMMEGLGSMIGAVGSAFGSSSELRFLIRELGLAGLRFSTGSTFAYWLAVLLALALFALSVFLFWRSLKGDPDQAQPSQPVQPQQ